MDKAGTEGFHEKRMILWMTQAIYNEIARIREHSEKLCSKPALLRPAVHLFSKSLESLTRRLDAAPPENVGEDHTETTVAETLGLEESSRSRLSGSDLPAESDHPSFFPGTEVGLQIWE